MVYSDAFYNQSGWYYHDDCCCKKKSRCPPVNDQYCPIPDNHLNCCRCPWSVSPAECVTITNNTLSPINVVVLFYNTCHAKTVEACIQPSGSSKIGPIQSPPGSTYYRISCLLLTSNFRCAPIIYEGSLPYEYGAAVGVNVSLSGQPAPNLYNVTFSALPNCNQA